jgi:hypothetical protein
MKDGMSEYDSPHKPHKLPWECVNSRPWENQMKGCAYGERVRMAGMKTNYGAAGLPRRMDGAERCQTKIQPAWQTG